MVNPLELVSAMAALLLTWGLAAAALIGLGLAVQAALARLLSIEPGPGSSSSPGSGTSSPGSIAHLPILFWIGYALAAGVLQLWHVRFAVSGVITTLLLLGGLTGLIIFGRAHTTHLLRSIRAHPRASCAYAALLAWAAMHALGVGDAHDSGLYHYPILQWLTSEPIVPGLGNIAVTFAHNSVHLLMAAALDQGFWSGRSEHVLNGLLVTVMALLAVRGIAKITARDHAQPPGGADASHTDASHADARADDAHYRWLHWYDALLLVPLLMVILSREITSPKTDAAPAFLVILMVRELVMLLLQHSQSRSLPGDDRHDDVAAAQRWRFIVLAILGATAVIVKLSTAPFVAAVCIAAAIIWLRDRAAHGTWLQRARTALICAGIGLVLIGPWMARNVIMTGYPVFPLRSFAFAVDWQVPPEPIEQFTSAIDVQSKIALPNLTYRTLDKLRPVPGWLRFELADDEPPGAVNWIPGWLVTMPAHSPVVCLVPLLLVMVCGVVMVLQRSALVPIPRAWLYAALPSAAALAFWFMTAPDPRYAIGLTWSLAGVCVAAVIGSRVEAARAGGRMPQRIVRMRRIVVLAVVLLPGVLAAVAWGVAEQVVRSGGDGVGEGHAGGHPIIGVMLQGPGPDRGLHPRPRIETTMWHSRHGVAIRRPVRGTLIWDEPQPAIGWPDPPDDLAYRQPGNLRAGFRVMRESVPEVRE